MYAPAAFGVLAFLDEADGFLEFFLDGFVGAHAVDFGEEEGGEAVGVHDAVGLVGGEQAGFLGAVEDVVEGVLDDVAVLAAAGEVAGGHEGEGGKGGDGGVGVVAAVGGAEGALAGLMGGEPGEAFFDGGFLGGVDLVATDLIGALGDVRVAGEGEGGDQEEDQKMGKWGTHGVSE